MRTIVTTIVKKALVGLNDAQIEIAVDLMMAPLDHPWMDDEHKSAIIRELCNNFDIDVPPFFAEENDEDVGYRSEPATIETMYSPDERPTNSLGQPTDG